MEAYCLKCKEKREIADAVAGFNARGGPVTTGTCSVCGSKIYRMGNTLAHEGLEKPVVEISKKSKTKKTASNKSTSKKKTEDKKSSKKIKASGKPLVIVESPAKARTIGRFLGKDYEVIASVGHVRDLLKSQLSVDVENNFEPKYRVPNEKSQLSNKSRKQQPKAKKVTRQPT